MGITTNWIVYICCGAQGAKASTATVKNYQWLICQQLGLRIIYTGNIYSQVATKQLQTVALLALAPWASQQIGLVLFVATAKVSRQVQLL